MKTQDVSLLAQAFAIANGHDAPELYAAKAVEAFDSLTAPATDDEGEQRIAKKPAAGKAGA